MQTPNQTPCQRNVPGSPLRSNWLFEPNIYELTNYQRILNGLFCSAREIEFALGWDKELMGYIHQAHQAGYTTLNIEYSPMYLSNYADMEDIVKYDTFLEENRNDIEDIKFDLLAQTNGEIAIENAYKELDKIIDILDLLQAYNARVKVYF